MEATRLTTAAQKEYKRIKRIAAIINMVPSLLWTALFLLPIAIFCYSHMAVTTVYNFLGGSIVFVLFPDSFFDKIQFSGSAQWYIRIGVKHINRFAQNGNIVNNLIRKRFPGFKVVSKSKASISRQYYQTYFFEKFHFSLFLFFMMVTIYAAVHSFYYWVLVLILCNLFYNVYPNLLQQYIRIRLKSAVTREDFVKSKTDNSIGSKKRL